MRKPLISQERAVAKLATEAKRVSLRGLARCLDVDAGNLCHVIHGRKDPEYILRRFGYERVVMYRSIPKGNQNDSAIEIARARERT